MAPPNDRAFPIASVTLSAAAQSSAVSGVARPSAYSARVTTCKLETGGRAELPKRNGPRSNKPPQPKWFLGKAAVSKRFLTGIGVTAGGLTYFGPAGKNSAALAGIFAWLKPNRAVAAEDKKRILVLMSMTGGGHKASAEAIEAGFKQLYGDKYHFDIVDAWTSHTPEPFNRLPETYSFLVKNPILWRASYTMLQPRAFHRPYMYLCGNVCFNGMNDLFAQYRPDLVVSVHPLMQHIPLRVMEKRVRDGLMPAINFATVVTDFTTCSNCWFHKGVTQCFVPTADCHQRATKMGLAETQITQYGLPIRPAFSKDAGKREGVRSRLGMDVDLPAVLLVGGGEGMGKLKETVREIGKRGTKCQVVVVCGRNAKLQTELNTTDFGANVRLQAEGFVTNMHEWMAACDTIITKAGPGTIAEALISGLPILLNGNVPCQEEGNIPYVLDNGCGTFERDPKKIANILHGWFEEVGRPTLATMAANCKALGRPDALFKICRDLAALTVHPEIESPTALATA